MMNDALSDVLNELRREQGFLIDLAQQLVRIPTVNPKLDADPSQNHEADLQYFLRTVLDDIGMRTQTADVLPGRPNLIARLPGTEARSLIFAAHIDVAPVGDRTRWRMAPFGGDIHEGRLYGRGAGEMKGGLAAAVAVARALRRCGISLEGRFELHALVDGMAGGQGARDVVKRGLRAAGLIAPHATGQALALAQCGQEWARVSFRGRGGDAGSRHGAIFPTAADPAASEPSVNALELAVRWVNAVRQLEWDWAVRKTPHPLLPPGCNTIQPCAFVAGADPEQQGPPRGPALRTRVPDRAVVDFALRLLPDEIAGETRADFEEFLRHFTAQDRWLRNTPPQLEWDETALRFPGIDTPPGHPLVRAVVNSRGVRNKPTVLSGWHGTSDAAHYADVGVPCVLYGPTAGNINAPDEYIEVACLISTTETLAAVALGWCGLS